MNPVDLNPIAPADRRQAPFDLFLIFAGANIVATTLQTGASLVPAFGLPGALALVAAGSLAGSLLIGVLSELGPRLGVPSVIAARAALGLRGAGLVALLLYATNFAWIAVNNVIAASACAQVAGGAGSERAWAVLLGILSTVIVAGGPRLVALADRLAVPLLLVVGVVLTIACLRLPFDVLLQPGTGGLTWFAGLDIVIGYQVSWILMFADYSRYTRSGRRAAVAVFLGLLVTGVWMMPLGFMAARAAGSPDPGAMMQAVHLGAWGALLMTVATLTTNFVNIYMSALAIRSLLPRVGAQASIWSTGLVGAALSLFSGAWLDGYANFMVVLGGILIPVGGVLLARFFLIDRQGGGRPGAPERHIADLYDPHGPYARHGGFDLAGLAAWGAGGLAYYAARPAGGTLPSLLAAVAVYTILGRRTGARQAG
jgi:NCS1 family nucleobase:cation symporter-1